MGGFRVFAPMHFRGLLCVCFFVAIVHSRGTLMRLAPAPTASAPSDAPATTCDPIGASLGAAPCPFNCSSHGKCANSTCTCIPDWGGVGCRWPYVELLHGQDTSAVIFPGTWRYFGTLIVNASNRVSFSIQCSPSNASSSGAKAASPMCPDAFVQRTPLGTSPLSWPTLSNFAYGSLGANSSTIDATYPMATQGTYIVGLHLANTSGAIPLSMVVRANASLQCPNQCSSHGRCTQGGVCQCNANYHRLDCSQEIIPAQLDKSYSGTMDDEVYFSYLQPSTNSQMVLDISVTGPHPFYVGFNVLPHPFNYTYSSSSSSSVPSRASSTLGDGDDTSTLRIRVPPSGQYYVGLFAPSRGTRTSYVLMMDLTAPCPNNCSGIGQCTYSGTCECPQERKGLDCSQLSVVLNNGQPFTGSFSTNQPPPLLSTPSGVQGNALTVHLDGNVRLYAQSGGHPNPQTYLFSMDGPNASYMLYHPPQTSITYALYPLVADLEPHTTWPFSLTSTIGTSCPNACSGRGTCSPSGTCDCLPHYSYRADCSLFVLDDMASSQNYSTLLPAQSWSYFSLNVLSANQLVFNVFTSPGESPPAFYVRHLEMPNTLQYTQRSNTSLPIQTLVIMGDFLQTGKWFIGVYNDAHQGVHVNVSASVLSICPNDCSGNGLCVGGICECKPTFVGDDCSSQDILLHAGMESVGSVTATQFNFYHIHVMGDNALEVVARERATFGKIWLYARQHVPPTKNEYQYADTSESDEHRFLIPSPNASGVWYIGVYGSPYLGFNTPSADYSIAARLGCEFYKECDTCAMDPNCGWCVIIDEFGSKSKKGFCSSGSSSGPSGRVCAAYFFDRCSVHKAEKQAQVLGVIIGVGMAICVFVSFGVVIGVIYVKWRSHKQIKQALPWFRPSIVSKGHQSQSESEEY